MFKNKTAYEVRSSDWSADVCSSDLIAKARSANPSPAICRVPAKAGTQSDHLNWVPAFAGTRNINPATVAARTPASSQATDTNPGTRHVARNAQDSTVPTVPTPTHQAAPSPRRARSRAVAGTSSNAGTIHPRGSTCPVRSEEHTYALQSLMRNTYAH